MTHSNGIISTKENTPFGHQLRKHFLFDENYLNLNHGSFGSFPLCLRATLQHFQTQCELRPDTFIRYTYPSLLDVSRSALANLLQAPVEEVVMTPNATTAVNTVLRNIVFEKGDKILYPSTTYGACEKTVEYICETTPAEAVKIEVYYPVEDDEMVSRFRDAVRGVRERGEGKVKIALFDTVVSLPGVRVPFERLVKVCREEGVLSLVDGAHGVGQIELDLGKLDADFFVSNCHKWLLAPRACAIFHVPLRNQALLRSTVPTSHGFIPLPPSSTSSQAKKSRIANPLPPSEKSAFVTSFEFTGTLDNSPYLCIPAALDFRREVCGGEEAIREYCTNLAREGGREAARVLGTEVLENGTQTLGQCFFANVRLPLPSFSSSGQGSGIEEDPSTAAQKIIQNFSRTMVEEHDTFIALTFHAGAVWARFSAMVYLEVGDFVKGAEVLNSLCEGLTGKKDGGDEVDGISEKVHHMTLQREGPEKAE